MRRRLPGGTRRIPCANAVNGRRKATPISRERLERLCVEACQATDDGEAVLSYVVDRLMPAPPAGIGLPDAWIDPLLVATGSLARLADQLSDPAPGWLSTVRLFEAWMRRQGAP